MVHLQLLEQTRERLRKYSYPNTPDAMKFSAIGAVLLGAAFVSAAFEGLSAVTTNSLQALAKRDLLSDILEDIEDAASCAGCEALLVVLKTLAALGNDDFVAVIVEICQDLVSFPHDWTHSVLFMLTCSRRALKMQMSGE